MLVKDISIWSSYLVKQFKLGSIFDMRTGPSNNNVLYYYYRHCENSSNYKYEGTDDTAGPKRCEKHYLEVMVQVQ